jgi:hypothetical protein
LRSFGSARTPTWCSSEAVACADRCSRPRDSRCAAVFARPPLDFACWLPSPAAWGFGSG